MDTKKRKLDGKGDDIGVGRDGAAEAGKFMAEMQAQITRMRGEIDGMKDRLSRIDDLETQSRSMRREIASLKTRIARVGELERKSRLQESRCRFLEARCNFLARTAQMLVHGDGEWEYSEPFFPSYSDWEERGFDLRAAQDADKLLQELKSATFVLRNETMLASGDDNVALGEGDENDEIRTILRYANPLLSHWTEFTDSLQMNRQPLVIQKFRICNMQLPTSILNMLSAALRQKSVKSLELHNIDFVNRSEGINFVVEFLDSYQQLQHFGMSNIGVESSDDIEHLLKVITSHTWMETVQLKNCFGNNAFGYHALCRLFAKYDAMDEGFFNIDFEANNLMTLGRTEMVNFLAANPPLTDLNLASNLLNDNDAMMIASALRENYHLQNLNLDQNNITDIGRDALGNAIFDSTSLNSLAASNHTCRIMGIDFGSIPVNDGAIIPEDVRRDTNRGKKLYNLLSSRNRMHINVPLLDSELEDDSLKLAPEILGCLQRYRSYCGRQLSAGLEHPLSIWYEMLRSWKMLALLENHRGPMPPY